MILIKHTEITNHDRTGKLSRRWCIALIRNKEKLEKRRKRIKRKFALFTDKKIRVNFTYITLF